MDNATQLALLANMGQTFRTPLSQILGFTEILREQIGGALNERQLAHVTSIEMLGTALHDVVSDLIDLARIETGRAPVVLASCRTQDVLYDVITTYQAQAQAQRVDILAQIDETLDPIDADRAWLTRLFTCLFANALAVAEIGSAVTVRLRASFCEPETSRAVLVSTTVAQPEPPTSEQCDEEMPFDHVAGIYPRCCQGYGVRLALADRITRQHSGSLTVESDTRSSLTVSVSLPITTESEKQSPATGRRTIA